jgi:hypothetical protein
MGQNLNNIKRVKRVHNIGSSKVVTLDPDVIKTLEIDNWTFLTQEPIENGILMKIMRLEKSNKEYD